MSKEKVILLLAKAGRMTSAPAKAASTALTGTPANAASTKTNPTPGLD